MKLTIDRREEQEGLFRKSTVYHLDFTIDLTPDELNLIKKHRWEGQFTAEGQFKTGIVMEIDILAKPGRVSSWPFKTAENLAYFENRLAESARSLKEQLEAAASFTSGGPREIDL